MKTVFDNAMTAHVWAQQTQEHGRSNNGNLYFRGRTIYSYRDTWPLAHFHESGLIIINRESYSISTSQHLNEVTGAIGYGRENVVSVHSTKILTAIVQGYGTNQDIANKICAETRDIAYSHIKQAAKRKKDSLRFSDIGDALAAISTAEKLCNALDSSVQFHQQLSALQEQLRNDSATLITAKGDEIKAENEAAKKRKAQEKEQAKIYHDEMLAKFRRGEGYSAWDLTRHTNKIYMRVKGDEIETSRGARFPVDHALKAFKTIRICKERGETYSRENVRMIGGNSPRLGHFTIDAIEANGNVKAGCHYVEWDEIELIARELKVFP